MAEDGNGLRPLNSLVGPLLTDMYQLSMAYAYWKQGRHEEIAVFELFFRKNPFQGEFTIFAGIDEVLKFLANYRFTASDVSFLRSQFPHAEEDFFLYLESLDLSQLKIYALRNGTVCFPRIALLRVEGPLLVGQLLETTLLNLVNFPSLVATNAARHRLAAGNSKILLEFGLRRAQGPDGGLTATKYSYIGGFDATSNVLAGKLLGIKISGTHAHAFVQAYKGMEDLKDPTFKGINIVTKALAYRDALGFTRSHLGELAAFIAFAQSFPENFLALVDTYDTLHSGVPNFMVVALVLDDLGHSSFGVRIDSGDLAYLSKTIRDMFDETGKKLGRASFQNLKIVASNDINEQVLQALEEQEHAIDVYGVGTNLVTCQAQPALGCVYKLVEIQGVPRIKLSNSISKVTIPCKKKAYRISGANGEAMVDLMTMDTEPAPQAGQRILCRNPFDPKKRVYITPSTVEPLYSLVFDGAQGGIQPGALESLEVSKQRVKTQLKHIRSDVLRYINPTPYKVSVSVELFQFFHKLWEEEMPINELA